MVDLTSLDISIESDFHFAFRHQVNYKTKNQKATVLRGHTTQMLDSIWHPFAQVTDEFEDLKIESFID